MMLGCGGYPELRLNAPQFCVDFVPPHLKTGSLFFRFHQPPEFFVEDPWEVFQPFPRPFLLGNFAEDHRYQFQRCRHHILGTTL